MKSLHDKVAVITGAGGGLGRALALELSARGCHLALVDVNPASLQEAAALLTGRPVGVSTHVVDVTDRAAMARLPDAVISAHGKVNVLVNNAGITLQKSFCAHALADWDRVIGINWWGTLYGCHFFVPHLKAAGEAHIVNMSSMAGFLGIPTQASYSSSKAAIRALSEALWAELARDGIGVSTIHPGAIRTGMMHRTLADSENLRVAQRNLELAARFGIPADVAARRIVRAIQRRQLFVRIGVDAYLVDLLKRLLPQAIHLPFRRLFASQMGSPGVKQ